MLYHLKSPETKTLFMKSFFVLRFFLLNFLLLLLFSNFPQEAFATRAYNHEITQSEFRHSTSPSKKELRKELRAQRKAQKKVSQASDNTAGENFFLTLVVVALIIGVGWYLASVLVNLAGIILFLLSIVGAISAAISINRNTPKEKHKKN